ncbi:3-oxoacyl-[acyl-carrier-protein] synthase, KASIII [Cystobacter fuscus DSM 2262]|uniref:3-oxoacyl-[acyl-carrier-protein] synthase, KASIII n=1 Tax=Cystobacter fuscus (strain ATCC 25194 / DSM 2262 / NBRC 100088 / M29) TaxID=1242864 RepID=S9QNB8_CYSF2|nr:3-oxoacyl-[acyl-carrier-protein] synthase, KASIII [Cystobacter fuscus DSM 2262]
MVTSPAGLRGAVLRHQAHQRDLPALRTHYLAASPERTPEGLSLIGHQANLRMLEAVQRRTEVADARHFYNVDHRGNCGASGAPTVLSENWDNPQLGDAVARSVVGSGLTWAGSLLERTVPST